MNPNELGIEGYELMNYSTMKTTLLAALATVLGAAVSNAATITPSVPSGQPAGSTITFTIGGEGNPNEAYRLSVGPANNPADVHVVYDYHDATPTFDWSPIDPGAYIVAGSVLNIDTGAETHVGMVFNIGPVSPQARFQGVVLPTTNPLVASYGAPPCPAGVRMRVRYFSPAVGSSTTTQAKQCKAGTTMHFLVSGMRENLIYMMQHQIVDAANNVLGQAPFIPFQTGTAAVAFAPIVEAIPFDIQASILESTIYQSPIVGNFVIPADPNIHAVDLSGNLIWYIEDTSSTFRPAGNGTFWTNRLDPITDTHDQLLGKVDLLGRVVQQTNTTQINRQLAARGDDLVNDFHHESQPLPNGHLAVLTTVEKFLTDEQGAGEVNVLADMIVVLNQDLQVVWTWNMFDWLDHTRLSSTGDVCATPGASGCGIYFNTEFANDWTHSNALAYSPEDNNLIVSIRHQDWIVKMDYNDGAGDGTILWRLGAGGDFTLTTGNDDDWFSHTHDPNYSGPGEIIVYDNSNLRCEAAAPPPDCSSRGQKWQIDENLMTATPTLNVDLGQYARAVGSAQLLLNGNYYFNSGIIGNPATTVSQFQEVKPDGTIILDLETAMAHYRSHRMINLYTMPLYWQVPQ